MQGKDLGTWFTGSGWGADAEAQLARGVFLTPGEVASVDWLGTGGSAGKLLTYVTDAAGSRIVVLT